MKDEALKLALEALEDFANAIKYAHEQDDIGRRACCNVLSYDWHSGNCNAIKAITAIKEALAQPEQEPVAWCVVGDGKFGEYKMGQTFVDYEATHTYWENRGYELVPVYTNIPKYTTPPAAQPAEQERNFCERCGKRTADLTVIHTCTPPPQEKT